MSVHRIHDPSDRYEYFREFTPVARAGYSICVYRVGLEEANRERKKLGLSELSSAEIEDWK
jgi:hypothetical protein